MIITGTKLSELRLAFRQELLPFYAPEELGAIEKEVFSHLTGFSPSGMVLEKDTVLTESQVFALQRAVKRLKLQEPVQYITQRAYFRGLELFVDKRVLIPRPETEELVGWLLSSRLPGGARVLDIGTGSGCIALSIKRECRGADVLGIDISGDTLQVARQNADRMGLEVSFLEMDILDQDLQKELGIFGAIISNPPYVTPSDRKLMKENVTRYEPHQALFVEEDVPLVYYRAITAFAGTHLVEGGKLFFECNESNATEVAAILGRAGFKNVELRNDMQGKERFVMGAR